VGFLIYLVPSSGDSVSLIVADDVRLISGLRRFSA
jgi:hypothetical protein